MQTFKPLITTPQPPEWIAKESTTLLAPDGEANVIASSEPLSEQIDSEGYATLQGALLRDEFPGYREIGFGPTDLFGDRKGYMRKFEWSPPDHPPVTQIQVYYVEGDRGFTATATLAQAGNHHEDVVLEVLQGLRLDG